MRQTVSLFKGMHLIQDDRYHLLGLDTVLLSDFASLKKNMKVCDLGAGVGALSLLIAGREESSVIEGIELLPGACAVAEENINANGLSGRIKIHCCDIKSGNLPLTFGSFDLVVTNPPYFTPGSGKTAGGERAFARTDESCPLAALIETSGKLLKWGGYFAAVYRPERLSELICCLKDNKVEPKRLRFVHKDLSSAPSLFLIEGKAGASSGIKVLPPLITKAPDGGESDELKRIYCRESV